MLLLTHFFTLRLFHFSKHQDKVSVYHVSCQWMSRLSFIIGNCIKSFDHFWPASFCTFCHLCLQNSQRHAAYKWHLLFQLVGQKSHIWSVFLSYFNCLSSGWYSPVYLCLNMEDSCLGFWWYGLSRKQESKVTTYHSRVVV